MKRLLLFLTAFLLLAVTYSTKAQTAEQQKAWTDYMTPGKIHQMLAKDDGDWTFDMTYWMSPGANASTSTGTTENKMVLGGRYQESVHKAMMEGMQFEGHGLLGYDNSKNLFQNTWADNMGTGIMFLEGKWDEPTKSITLRGKSFDPMTGKDMEVKQVYKMVDDDHHTLEMYMPSGDKEFKNMEIKFTRKK
ncbi:Protein of unknown function [Chitinophaga sp. CF118]|uniref:DUF1579 domain-containing protein n=1 Tax=Chitinophaga sp. CF118 TaxID=1884367 RepID=UPI0008E14DC0|nr:DUF1579 domain-containing protein [Chitinophaga sp. CF118]SFE96039.1 Protein of unknown function [Chitinophaga sp. CF118]